MDKVKSFFGKELFAVDGLHITVTVVVAALLIWYVFFRKK